MKKIIALAVFLSFSVFGQEKTSDKTFLGHNGGNGGEGVEILIKSNLLRISHLLNSGRGQALFGKDLNPELFQETVNTINIRVLDDELQDKFKLKRCALNFPEEKLIVFNRKCVEDLKQRPADFFVLISHEVLNVMGLELPDENRGSIYPISTRIGSASSTIVDESKSFVFSRTCNLDIRSLSEGLEIPNFGMKIFREKGYKKVNLVKSDSLNHDHVKLTFHLLSEKFDKYQISGNTIMMDGQTFLFDHGFMNRKFNGLMVSEIEDSGISFTPVRINGQKTIVKLGKMKLSSVIAGDLVIRRDSEGKSFRLWLKKGYEPALIETLLKMPSCVNF